MDRLGPYKLLFLLLSTMSMAVVAEENMSTLQDQTSLALTIYNNDLALVKDARKVQLKTGISALALRDVSAKIKPETALLRNISSPNSLQVLEQNFDFDLLTPNKLLEKYVGKTVTIIKTHPITGEEISEQASVLSANNGPVLKIGQRIETGIHGRIVYDSVPSNLRDRPTLSTLIKNTEPSLQELELNYLTHGLSWKADYVAELSHKEDTFDLSGWVTLTNTSGASYHQAKLQLVAGNVNTVQTPTRILHKAMREDMAVASAAAPVSEESLLEYHLYSVGRPTSILDNQTKQVALLNANNVPVNKSLVLRGADYYYMGQYGEIGHKLPVGVFLEFDNKESSKLGIPLPSGILRVYKKDSTGNAQFIGEDRIDHTPKNESVRLKLGDAFDVTANKKQTDFKILPKPSKGNSAYESAYEITLKNAKKEKVVVSVQEPIGGDWKVVYESSPHVKENSQLAVWKIEIPSESSATLRYRVNVKY